VSTAAELTEQHSKAVAAINTDRDRVVRRCEAEIASAKTTAETELAKLESAHALELLHRLAAARRAAFDVLLDPVAAFVKEPNRATAAAVQATKTVSLLAIPFILRMYVLSRIYWLYMKRSTATAVIVCPLSLVINLWVVPLVMKLKWR
jgi:hypothetical protein